MALALAPVVIQFNVINAIAAKVQIKSRAAFTISLIGNSSGRIKDIVDAYVLALHKTSSNKKRMRI